VNNAITPWEFNIISNTNVLLFLIFQLTATTTSTTTEFLDVFLSIRPHCILDYVERIEKKIRTAITIDDRETINTEKRSIKYWYATNTAIINSRSSKASESLYLLDIPTELQLLRACRRNAESNSVLSIQTINCIERLFRRINS